MADVQFQFSTNGVDPRFSGGSGGFSPGLWPAMATSAEFRPTKDGNGQMLVITVTGIDGAMKGITQDVRLNIQNSSTKAMKIAYEQLCAICVVCNRPQGIQQAASEIFNVPFLIEIAPQKETADTAGKGYTEVVAVYHANGAEPGKQPPAQPRQLGPSGATAAPSAIPGSAPGASAFGQQQPAQMQAPGAGAFGGQQAAPQAGYAPQGQPHPYMQPAGQPNGGAFAPQQQGQGQAFPGGQPQPMQGQQQPAFQGQAFQGQQGQAPAFGGMPGAAQQPFNPGTGGMPGFVPR